MNICCDEVLSFCFESCDNESEEFFTISPQCKNANIANFVLGVPLEMNFEIRSSCTHWHLISHLLVSFIVNKKKTVKIWEYKVGNNVNIANFVGLWKSRIVWFECPRGPDLSLRMLTLRTQLFRLLLKSNVFHLMPCLTEGYI